MALNLPGAGIISLKDHSGSRSRRPAPAFRVGLALPEIRQLGGCWRVSGMPSMHSMNASVASHEKVRSSPATATATATARPYLLSALAALSIGAAVIHF